MLEAIALGKVFRGRGGGPFWAVREVTLSVRKGEVYGLIGPNGAGKTTLLRMIALMMRPDEGEIRLDGQAAADRPDALRHKIGFASGNTRLYGRLTPREILLFFGRLYGMSRAQIERRTAELGETFGLLEFLDARCDTLSTGQLQRVSIARVALHDPPLLVLDEPANGLDVLTSEALFQFIRQAAERGVAVVLSMHQVSAVESLCARVGLIHRGRLVAQGRPEEICRDASAPDLRTAFIRLVSDTADAAGGRFT